MSSNVFNMPSGTAFLPSLAAGLRDMFGDDLQNGLILLPTRRAVRAMGEAFVLAAQNDDSLAALLPRMRPLADVNPEEPPFEPGELIGKVAPAIDPMQRRFELAQLVARYHERAADMPIDPATALAMADPLLSIMDDAAMEEVNFTQTEAWKDVTAEAAVHFQHAAKLYQIIEEFWPQRLAELGMMEAQARKVALLNLLTDTWIENPPDYPVIIAGSTGTLKATARLMRCVANLPKGRIVLPGLQEATNDVWDNIDVQHPQYSLKNLLETIGVERQNVTSWPLIKYGAERVSETADLPARRLLLSEALVPVSRTSDWLGRIEVLRQNGGDDIFARAMNGLSLIEARTDDDEALAIALIMRETLETEGRTAALVTPDQALASRVKARLTRWDINVDMSQGGLLSETPLGVFLDSLLELCQTPDNPLALSVVFNHGLSCLGQSSEDLTAQWQGLEREKYRGIPNPEYPPDIPRGEDPIVKDLNAAMMPLLGLSNLDAPSIWAEALIDAAENIARSDVSDGEQNLWLGEAGSRAVGMLESLIAYGASLPPVDARGFSRLLQSLMSGMIVRPKSGTHPRLSILGPLEARMLSVHVTILGGLNEGIWPVTPKSGPFLSRGMRSAMKLSLPERRYGLAAHDFAELAANPKTYLTRSKRSSSGPMIASRWVWRLQTLLQGALDKGGAKAVLTSTTPYLEWAAQLDKPEKITPAAPPAPTPPVDKRWGPKNKRGLSITSVQTWIRDPYAIYARYCLGLSKLDGLGETHGPREFGSAVHKGIENFLEANKSPFSPDQAGQLTQDFKAAMDYYGFPPEDVAKETARFEDLSRNFIDWLVARNKDGFDIVGQEVWAKYQFEDLNFNLRGILDLVERRPDGYSFIDHKTGDPSSVKAIEAGFDPQLPLAAFLADKGGLEDMKAAPTSALGYIRVKGSNDGFEHRRIAENDHTKLKTAQELADEAVETLRKLIEAFDQEETAYPSQPRAQYVNKYGDFDDLARRGEWSGIGGEDAP